jgi:hypothetical protein
MIYALVLPFVYYGDCAAPDAVRVSQVHKKHHKPHSLSSNVP